MRIGSSNSRTVRRVAGPRRVPQKSGRRGMAEATGLGETQHKAARHHVGLACFPEILFRNVSNVKRHKCHMNDTFTCARAHHK